VSSNKSEDHSVVDRWMQKNRSLVLRQSPVWAQGIALVVVGLSTIGVVSASIFRIDEVVTVPGRLVPSKGASELKSLVGGKISEVYVTDGDLVAKDQALAVYDTREAVTNIKTYTTLIGIERDNLSSKLKILDKRSSVFNEKLKTNKYILKNLKKLVDDGGYQRIQYLNKLDEVFEISNNLESVALEKKRVELDSLKTINQYENALKQSQLKLQNQTLFATSSGVIFDSQIKNNSIVREGEILMNIIPQTGLQASVRVSNKDIGFVKVGQNAAVRVDAFPFSTFGELTGTVSSISADAKLPDKDTAYYSFPVLINLESDKLLVEETQISLRSGMSIQANLRLRDKPIISLLSDLLVDKTEGIRSIRQ